MVFNDMILLIITLYNRKIFRKYFPFLGCKSKIFIPQIREKKLIFYKSRRKKWILRPQNSSWSEYLSFVWTKRDFSLNLPKSYISSLTLMESTSSLKVPKQWVGFGSIGSSSPGAAPSINNRLLDWGKPYFPALRTPKVTWYPISRRHLSVNWKNLDCSWLAKLRTFSNRKYFGLKKN